MPNSYDPASLEPGSEVNWDTVAANQDAAHAKAMEEYNTARAEWLKQWDEFAVQAGTTKSYSEQPGPEPVQPVHPNPAKR